MTLADALRAAVAGKIDPVVVFNALPKNCTAMIDQAARNAAQSSFVELPKEAQRALFAVIREATPEAKTPPSDATLAASAPSVKRPWWKFW